MTEKALMSQIRHELNVSMRCRLVRQNVGVDTEKGVRYGYKGQPDLIGVLRSGRCFCLEIKVPGGRIRPDQVNWWRSAYQWGVTGGVCRSLEGAWRALEDAERGVTYLELRDYE